MWIWQLGKSVLSEVSYKDVWAQNETKEGRFKLKMGKWFWTVRASRMWNYLPQIVVLAVSMNIFKRLDSYHNILEYIHYIISIYAQTPMGLSGFTVTMIKVICHNITMEENNSWLLYYFSSFIIRFTKGFRDKDFCLSISRKHLSHCLAQQLGNRCLQELLIFSYR